MLGFLRAMRSCSSSSEGIFDTLGWGRGEVAGNQTSEGSLRSTLPYSTGRHEHQDARTLLWTLVQPLAQRQEAMMFTSMWDAQDISVASHKENICLIRLGGQSRDLFPRK